MQQKFKVGDHVIVDEGDDGHYLAVGLDGLVVDDNMLAGCVRVEGVGGGKNGNVHRQWVKLAQLIKVDDLVTGPFAPGDRALVVGNSATLLHYLDVGTDVEILAGPAGKPVRYDVLGVSRTHGGMIQQSVSLADLEAEPTFTEHDAGPTFKVGDHAAAFERIFPLSPDGLPRSFVVDSAGVAEEFDIDGPIPYTIEPCVDPARLDALRDAYSILGDVSAGTLIDVAEWLYTGKVPA